MEHRRKPPCARTRALASPASSVCIGAVLLGLSGCPATGTIRILGTGEVSVLVRPLECADPLARSEGPWQVVPLDVPPPDRAYLWAAAAAVEDVDGDLDLDVVVLSVEGPVLFRNPDWQPEPMGALDRPMGAAFADIDGDRDADLYVSSYSGPDMLYVNDGTGAFTAEPERLVGDPGYLTSTVSFADIDQDGDLDALALTTGDALDDPSVPVRHFPPSHPALLWKNRGDGVFDESSSALPDAVHTGFSLAGGLHDLDQDGAVDVYAVNDFGGAHGPNVWVRGDGAGQFFAPELGHGLDITTTGMGLALGDINGDGTEDAAVAHWGGIRVLESGAPGLWFDTTVIRIPEVFGKSEIAWGGDFIDIDNDRDLDLYVSFGFLQFTNRWPNPLFQPDRLYLGGSEGAWEDAAAAWQLDEGAVTRGTVFADLDDDGWLDLVRPSQDAPALLLSRCGEARGARVSLRQPGPNPFAVGARLTLSVEEDVQLRTVRAGGTNYGSAGPAEVHFGLGTARSGILTVTWPDRSTTSHELAAGSHATITRF